MAKKKKSKPKGETIALLKKQDVPDLPIYDNSAPLKQRDISETVSCPDIDDHFSLRQRASRITLAGARPTKHLVWNDGDAQHILSDGFDADGKSDQSMKVLKDMSTGQGLLRASYTLVCLFFSGFLFVTCIQLLGYLILDMLIASQNDNDIHVRLQAVGTALAFPFYIIGLTTILVTAGTFVMDTWNSSELLKRFVFDKLTLGATSGATKVEWLTFIIYLGIPLVVLSASIYSGTVEWWEATSLAWFHCVSFSFVAFFITLLITENNDSFAVMETLSDILDDGKVNLTSNFFETLGTAIKVRQQHYFSATVNYTFLSDCEMTEKEMPETRSCFRVSLYSRIVSLRCFSCLFEEAEEGTKLTGGEAEIIPGYKDGNTLGVLQYDMEDVRDIHPFLTRGTWSLEKMFCREPRSRYVVVYDGPESLTQSQFGSTIVCFFVGYGLVFAVSSAFVFWLSESFGVAAAAGAAILCLNFTRIRAAYRFSADIWPLRHALKDEEGEVDSKAVFQVWKKYRTVEPNGTLCFLILAAEVFFLFLCPFAALVSMGNYPSAAVFTLLAAMCLVRSYFDPAVILEATNNMELVDRPDRGLEWSAAFRRSPKHWNKKSRLNSIVANVTRSQAIKFWSVTLIFFLVILLGLATAAVCVGNDMMTDKTLPVRLPDFHYTRTDDLPYPTCSIGKNQENTLAFEKNEGRILMSDYAFLSVLAYSDTAITQPQLDEWFGPGAATDEHQYVSDYRAASGDETYDVSYKLISFKQSDGSKSTGLLSIKGTKTPFEFLADFQLWSSAALFQVLREMLPIGDMFTPIMKHLVTYISALASKSINKIAFYKQTTAFVKHLQEEDSYGSLHVTGHSLGGGLAIITAAQTGIPGVALSGPNALIGLQTFDPPLTKEALDTLTFNIIPDSDPVPRFDDRAALFEEIRCTAAPNAVGGCHSSARSLCEILYTCGSSGRPVPCNCVTDFGYPAPKPMEGVTRTFEEACGIV